MSVKREKGSVVEFENLGFKNKGTIEDILPDGKYKVKDDRGYIYRLTEGAFLKEGAAASVVTEPTAAVAIEESQKPSINPQPSEPMSKKETTPPAPSTANAAQITKIAGIECKKHQRIFLLMEAGCDKAEIMKHAKANLGEISNVRKQYADEAKATAARALLA